MALALTTTPQSGVKVSVIKLRVPQDTTIWPTANVLDKFVKQAKVLVRFTQSCCPIYSWAIFIPHIELNKYNKLKINITLYAMEKSTCVEIKICIIFRRCMQWK